MKWNLIFKLSLVGYLMAVATTFLIPTSIEIFFWIPIYFWYAQRIAKKADGNYFLHGLFLGIVNSLWISLVHAILFTKYIFYNGYVTEMLTKVPKIIAPRVSLIIYGPILGVVAGVIIGLMAVAFTRFVEPENA